MRENPPQRPDAQARAREVARAQAAELVESESPVSRFETMLEPLI